MAKLLQRRSSYCKPSLLLSPKPQSKPYLFSFLFTSQSIPNYQFTPSIENPLPLPSHPSNSSISNLGCPSFSLKNLNFSLGSISKQCFLRNDTKRCGLGESFVKLIGVKLFGTQAAAAVEPSTSDGLTVEGILSNQWTILDESESDWKSHSAAISQSIHLIKKRLQWKKLLVRLKLLGAELDKPDIWDDPVHAGKISREHGSLMGKMKEVVSFEQELLEHIDMIKLAREENDTELESVGSGIN